MEYRIQEISQILQVPPSTVRFWETEFSNVIKPARTQGGQRRFSDQDIEYLKRIKELLHIKKQTIAQVKDLFQSGNGDKEKIEWERKTILLTGGTGTFGYNFCRFMLENHPPRAIRIFSRGELKQKDPSGDSGDDLIRYCLGDVREPERLRRAMEGVDLVIHAAALKQFFLCEFNPFETVKTNILGAQNVIDAAIDVGVKKVIALSSDMAVNPTSLYGTTKLCAEKMFIQGNVYSGARGTAFSCIRLPELLTRKGNLLDAFRAQRKTGSLCVSDPEMTRFWPDLRRSAESVLKAFVAMRGGEIFVPLSPSIRVMDLAEAFAPECRIKIIGMGQAERLHSTLISPEESRNSIRNEEMFVLLSDLFTGDSGQEESRSEAEFSYESRGNNDWLSIPELQESLPELL